MASDLVLLAMGFVGPDPEGLLRAQLDGLGGFDSRGCFRAQWGSFRTPARGVFAAGDCRRGQSLVVWAINEGRGVANQCHLYLLDKSQCW